MTDPSSSHWSTSRLRRGVRAPLGHAALGVLLVASCAHGPSPRPAASAAGGPRIVSEDDFVRVRADYDVLPLHAPDRTATRSALEAWLLGEARRARAADRSDDAWDALQRALGLWDADELKGTPRDPALAAAADEFERFYRRRGGHREAITLIGVQLSLAAEDLSARARFDQVSTWLRGDATGGGARCDDGCERLIEDLESAVAAWPSPFLVDQLADLYWQRQRAAASFGNEGGSDRPASLADLMRHRALSHTGFDLTRLYLRVSQPEKAQAALARLGGQPGDDPALREALERAMAAGARPMDAVWLAVQIARDHGNRAVGARVCRDATRRFPNSAEPQLCVGELAVRLDQITVAIRAFERAIEIVPDKRDAWEALARLHQARLAQLVGDERTDQLDMELKKVEAFHDSARKRFPGDPLKTSLAGALYEVGRGYYNAGRIDDALRYLARSMQVSPTVLAQEQLALIELKRERAPEALKLYGGAIEMVKQRHTAHESSNREQAYWLAKLYRGVGDGFEEMGDARDAAQARHRSLEAWEQLLAQHLDADETAEAELERGKLLYLLGERERGIAALERAIDALPERSSTYADTLAFLVPRGEQGEALDAYHRALGRAGVSEYIKVYASLWILELGRRRHDPEDPAARQFLENVHGARWHHYLARWATGRETDTELAIHADTPGKRCELDFYRAMRSLGDGRIDEARDLWRKVIGSRMMAFFEYDMASYYLRHSAELVSPPGPAHSGGATQRR